MGHGMVELFADAGVDLYHQSRLAEGLELLAARLDLAGAGELLTQICGLDFTDSDKTDPKPVPTPKPQPPPPPRPPQPKGWRS